MKVGKHYVGKMVEFTWRDPVAAFRSRNPFGGYPPRLEMMGHKAAGLEALSVWTERGVIVDITDGVVKIEHSHGEDSLMIDADGGHDGVYSWVPESLIESIDLYEKKEEQPA